MSEHMMKRMIRRSMRHERAFTLIEIMVTVAVMLIVLGLAYGALHESGKATRQLILRQEATQYCLGVSEQITRMLRTAIPPGELNAQGVRSAVKPRFEARELSVIALDPQDARDLCQITVYNEVDTQEEDAQVVRQVNTLPGSGGKVAEKRTERLGAGKPEGFRPEVRFSYAQVASPDAPPVFKNQWPADQWPDLIRVTMRVELSRTSEAEGQSGSPPDLEFSTAVIPGGLPVRQETPTTTPRADGGRAAQQNGGSAASRTSPMPEVQQ